ncbi:MAG: hypothetical protein ACK5HY_01300 [Parahaliea sp.]
MSVVAIGKPKRAAERIPVLLKKSVAEKYMRANPSDIPVWDEPPRKKWFVARESASILILGDCYYSEEQSCLLFNGGRHRTQWLLESDSIYLPVYTYPRTYYTLFLSGVIHRRAFFGEIIEGLTISNLYNG